MPTAPEQTPPAPLGGCAAGPGSAARRGRARFIAAQVRDDGQLADGRWQMADGRWPMADGRWPMVDGRWSMARRVSVARRIWLLDRTAARLGRRADAAQPAHRGQAPGRWTIP